MSEKKKVKEICGNCRLFKPAEGENEHHTCKVVILYGGGRIHIPVDPEDPCFFKNKFVASPYPFKQEHFQVPIQQVKVWVENPETGKPTDGDGDVKIEYPEGFFGPEEG